MARRLTEGQANLIRFAAESATQQWQKAKDLAVTYARAGSRVSDIAKAAGVSRTAVYDWIAGK